jgi:hypothetical protein
MSLQKVSSIIFSNFAAILFGKKELFDTFHTKYKFTNLKHSLDQEVFLLSYKKIGGSPIFCMYFPFSMQIQSYPENLVLIALEIFFHCLPARQFLKLAPE